MFNAEIGGQISWLIPAALILLAAGLYFRGRRPRTDTRRAAYLVWGALAPRHGARPSRFMAGIFHAYYTVALAPAVAALVGMGAAEAWERRAQRRRRDHAGRGDRRDLGVGLRPPLAARVEWNAWLRIVVLAVGLAAALGFLVLGRIHRRAVPVVVGAALFAALLGPAAYSVQTVATGHSGSIVDAGPTVAGGTGGPGGGGGAAAAGTRRRDPGSGAGRHDPGQAPAAPPGSRRRGGMGGLLDASTPSTAVVSALSANADQYTWVAAAIGSQNAAGLQLGTQLPVMAIGGFNGSDPSPTLAQFQAYVQAGKIHYFLGGGGFGGGQNGGSNVSSQISLVGPAELHRGDHRRLDVLRPDPARLGNHRRHEQHGDGVTWPRSW